MREKKIEVYIKKGIKNAKKRKAKKKNSRMGTWRLTERVQV